MKHRKRNRTDASSSHAEQIMMLLQQSNSSSSSQAAAAAMSMHEQMIGQKPHALCSKENKK
jgi:hypothetical protein